MARFESWVYETAPCLKVSPYRDAACDLVEAALRIGDDAEAWLLKTMCAYAVFHLKRGIEELQDAPIPLFIRGLELNTELLRKAREVMPHMKYAPHRQESAGTVVQATASHYANLFAAFPPEKYFDEPAKLLKDRLERNGYPLEKFSRWTALDIGCGNGRYTVALRRLGFKAVWGVDLASLNIRDAVRRLQQSSLSHVSYGISSALDLPFGNESFDFVFHNGCLHHTPDMPKGVREMLRVLKKRGIGYHHVMPSPGGIHWDAVEILRVVMRGVPFEFARTVLTLLGVPPNLRYLMLDHIMVPINTRLTREEAEQMLCEAGAVSIRKLMRGADFDREERITRGEPYAAIKYGIGGNRYYFEKP